MPKMINTTAIMMAFRVTIDDAAEGSKRMSVSLTLLASLKVKAN